MYWPAIVGTSSFKKIVAAILLVVTCWAGWFKMFRVSHSFGPLGELVQNSSNFSKIHPFYTKHNRIANLAGNNPQKQIKILEQAQATYPIVHQKVIALMRGFLKYKQEHGSSVEKAFYKDKDSFDVSWFITRLLTKRPVMFMGPGDSYILRTREQGTGGFDTIGTLRRKKALGS